MSPIVLLVAPLAISSFDSGLGMLSRTSVTASPPVSEPVQPETPVNCVPPLVPVYAQVPVRPATVSLPLGPKPLVDVTLSVSAVPLSVWEPVAVVLPPANVAVTV